MSNSLSVPNLAIRLADIFPRQRWHPRALAFLESQLGAPWAIACSGGADSLLVCLLSWAYWPEQRNRLTVLHYNHALRAEASDADANFVAQMAEALGIPCIQQRAAANVTNHSSEASLRDARYSFLESAMHPRGAHTLLLGHQADDVAETFLMRLARGSGLGGLVAPRPLTQIGQIWRVRPLIDISKKDIQTALESVGLVWREDASNAGGSYLRNRVRNAVMPVLEAVLGADWLAGVQASRELLEEDATALDAWAATVLSHARTGQPLDWRPIAHAPLAVQRRALYRWLAGFKLVLEKASFEAVLKNLNQGQAGSWNAGHQRQIVFEAGQLSLQNDLDEAALWASAEHPTRPFNLLAEGVQLPNGAWLQAEVLDAHDFNATTAPDPFAAYLALPAALSELFVRFWQPGDHYQPLGSTSSKKLQDLFIDAKVPRAMRHQLPLIMDAEGTILWIPGLRRSEKTRLQSGFRPWKLTYRPPA